MKAGKKRGSGDKQRMQPPHPCGDGRASNRMAEDYGVDPVYVLDMYRHGRASRMLDSGLRLAAALAVYVGAAAVLGRWRRQIGTNE